MAADFILLLPELTSGDDDRAEAAAVELAGFGSVAFPALRGLLASPEEDTRWWALRALAENPEPPVECFNTALSDEANEVRQCAALGIIHHPNEAAIPYLIRLLSDPEPVTIELTWRALAAIGAPAVPSLLKIPKDASLGARIGTVRALAEISDPRAIPTLMSALEEDSISMQYWAGQGLERLGLGMVYLKPE